MQNLNRTKEEEIQRPKSQAKETLERMAEIWDRWLPPKAVDSLRKGKPYSKNMLDAFYPLKKCYMCINCISIFLNTEYWLVMNSEEQEKK